MAIKKASPSFYSRKRASGAGFRDLARGSKEGLLYIASHFWMTVFVWLLMGVALTLPSGLWLLYQNLNTLLVELGEQVGFTVYFESGVTEYEVERIAAQLIENPEVIDVKTTSSEQALNELIDLSNLPRSLISEGFNPLPASLSVRLEPSTSEGKLTLLSEKASEIEVVNEVVKNRFLVERTSTLLEILKRLLYVAATLFGLSAFLISGTAVRLAINERMAELKVLNLAGSPRGHQRKLFQTCGILYGIGGGLMTYILLVGIVLFLEYPVLEYGTPTDIGFALQGFNWQFLLAIMGVATVLGFLGGSLSADLGLRKFKHSHEL